MSKFYLKITEEISFINKNINFNDAVWLLRFSYEGVKYVIYKVKKLVFQAKE